MKGMYVDMTEEKLISVAGLFHQIIKNNPPLTSLSMFYFSAYQDLNENMGGIILDALLSSSIGSLSTLNFRNNRSWFEHPATGEERKDNLSKLD